MGSRHECVDCLYIGGNFYGSGGAIIEFTLHSSCAERPDVTTAPRDLLLLESSAKDYSRLDLTLGRTSSGYWLKRGSKWQFDDIAHA